MPAAYRVRAKIWVEADAGPVLTPARVEILREIRRHPSLAEAARALKIPYKKAHRLVASVEKRTGGGLLSATSGGAAGGSTTLSPQGARLLDDYERLCNRVFETLSTATILGLRPVAEVATGTGNPAVSPCQATSMTGLYDRARALSGHECPGMVLGVRMAVAGMAALGVAPLSRCPRLGVTVETARCAADAIQAVSQTSVGRSSLRVVEHGKTAATFALEGEPTGVRVLALESSREAADRLFADLPGKEERQMMAYRALPDEALLAKARVRFLGRPEPRRSDVHARALCPRCSESFEQRAGVVDRGELLCASCAGGGYFERVPQGALPL